MRTQGFLRIPRVDTEYGLQSHPEWRLIPLGGTPDHNLHRFVPGFWLPGPDLQRVPRLQ